MSIFKKRSASIVALFLWFHAPSSPAATYNITSASDFSSLPSTLAAGDEITIQNGTYNNVGRTLTAAGTAGNPVRMYAVNPGNVYFSGGTQFVLKGSHMVISGLSFDGDVAPGNPKYSSGIFRFEANSSDMILRDCLVRNYDANTDPSGAYWIQVNGYRHTVEYCSFIGKSSEDQLINIIPTEDDGNTASKDIPRKHLIRHCYFADRTNIGLNGYETIQIGESQYQMYDMSTTVEYCLFKRAIYGPNTSNFEPEVITSKSRNNIYRYNTFLENKGGLVLRHGDDCVVDGNFFFGVDEAGSEFMGGGLRISGLRHIVRNNYFDNVKGTGLRAAICLMKGSGEFPPDSTSNGYESPGTARIFHNTIVSCNEPFALGATTSSSGTTAPNNVEIRNNVVQSAAADGPVIDFNSANGWSISQIMFSGNQAYHPSGTYGTVPASGFATGTPVNLALDVPLGYQVPQAGSPVINSAAATSPATIYDIRSMLRAGPPHDAGDYDTEGTGPSYNHPLVQSDVGPVFDGRTNPDRVPTLITPPASQSVFEGDPGVFTVVATNETASAFGYQWRRDEIAIAGATNSTFTILSAVPADEGSYSVAVTNAGGRTISYPAVLTVAPAAPVITSQPAPQLKSIGDNATFTVAADGIAPFTYQWRKDSTPIASETNASFTVTNIQSADAGNYSVVVSNAFGSATSQDAELTIVGGNILLSDEFSDGMFNNQSLPASAKWYTSGGSLDLLSNALQVDKGRMALAFFKDTVGNVQSLGVGEQLTASFTLNFISVGNSGSGFRFGFFNSNGQPRPPDTSDSVYTLYDGYIATITGKFPDHNANTSGPITFRQRNPGGTGKLLGTTGSGNYSTVTASPDTSQEFVAGIDYNVTLTIARTAAGTVTISVAVTGGSLSDYGFATLDDDLDLNTDFDGFAVLSTSSNGSDYTIDNVTIVHDDSPLLARFNTSPSSGGAPLSVDFTDTSTGTITNRFWDFGDGTTTNTTATGLLHDFTLPGSNIVTLIVSDTSGSSTNTQLIVATSVDTVGDGIPDWWRALYFGDGSTTNADSCANCDIDDDGMDTLGEYMADTVPTNGESRLAFISLAIHSNDVQLVWTGGSNAWQSVYCSENLADTNVWNAIYTNMPPTSVTNLLLDTGSTNGFYRIEAWR